MPGPPTRAWVHEPDAGRGFLLPDGLLDIERFQQHQGCIHRTFLATSLAKISATPTALITDVANQLANSVRPPLVLQERITAEASRTLFFCAHAPPPPAGRGDLFR